MRAVSPEIPKPLATKTSLKRKIQTCWQITQLLLLVLKNTVTVMSMAYAHYSHHNICFCTKNNSIVHEINLEVTIFGETYDIKCKYTSMFPLKNIACKGSMQIKLTNALQFPHGPSQFLLSWFSLGCHRELKIRWIKYYQTGNLLNTCILSVQQVFVIYLGQSLQNHVYSPFCERPPVLRDHKI